VALTGQKGLRERGPAASASILESIATLLAFVFFISDSHAKRDRWTSVLKNS
jgi:hypothetical protein